MASSIKAEPSGCRLNCYGGDCVGALVKGQEEASGFLREPTEQLVDCLVLSETGYIIIVVDKLSRPCYYILSINRVYMGELYYAKLNVEGRIVIPAACRKHIGLQLGEEVLIKVMPVGLLLTRNVASNTSDV